MGYLNLEVETIKPKMHKEMLSIIKLEDDRLKVRINFSSMDIINTCPRKAHYLLDRRLIATEENEATLFGSAIHKALEVWYSADPQLRKYEPKLKEEAQVIGYEASEPQEDSTMLRAIYAFAVHAKELNRLPDNEKRSLYNGVTILLNYFKTYENDGLLIVPGMVEKDFSFTMHEDDKIIIEYFGRIDAIMQDPKVNLTYIVDHKTTSSVSAQFLDRIKPNHQYTGYLMGANALGIDTNLFMVNGIQVAKTKCEFNRQVTDRNAEDKEELKMSVLSAIGNYLDYLDNNLWPQNAPQPCTMYGKCAFIDVCRVPHNIKENIIQARWQKEN